MAARAFITGLSGLNVSANERAFLKEAQPWGLIIFKRNVNTPQQVTELANLFRDAVGWAAPVLVDQEGGRVQRLGPPHWPVFPPGARYGALYDRDVASGLAAARLAGHLIAAELNVLGIDVDCLPLADVLAPGADPVSDDVSMKALSGTIAERSRAAFAAGCDVVLHCNGDLGEMTAVATAAPPLAGEAAARAEAALAQRKAPEEFDVDAARKIFMQMVDAEQSQRKTGS